MASKLLGLCNCPECGFPDAQIKADKGGNPYRYCPDCNTQTFTRGDKKRVDNMLKKIRPGTGPAAETAAPPASPPAAPAPSSPPGQTRDTPPAVPAKKSTFDLGQL